MPPTKASDQRAGKASARRALLPDEDGDGVDELLDYLDPRLTAARIRPQLRLTLRQGALRVLQASSRSDPGNPLQDASLSSAQ